MILEIPLGINPPTGCFELSFMILGMLLVLNPPTGSFDLWFMILEMPSGYNFMMLETPLRLNPPTGCWWDFINLLVILGNPSVGTNTCP